MSSFFIGGFKLFFYSNLEYITKIKKQISINKLSEISNIKQNTLNDVIKNHSQPKLDLIVNLSIGLKKLNLITSIDDLVFKDLSKESSQK